MVYLAKT